MAAPTSTATGPVPSNWDSDSDLDASSNHPITTSSPPVASTSGGRINTRENQGRALLSLPREEETAAPKRRKPILANRVDLCRETGKLVSDSRLSIEIPTVIPTTYTERLDHSRAENVAANLVLDLNICFEERLQHLLENEAHEHLTTSLKQGIELIHEQLGIESIQFDPDKPLGKEHRKQREEFISKKLLEHYPRGKLKILCDEKNGTDAAISAFIRDNPITGTPPDEVAKIHGYVKLLKMLWGQHPYFGGSVEYKQNITDSMEYWVYHMSTLTRDPDRNLPVSEMLLKPLKDYTTHPDGLMPHMNQRNLGTGVAEATWDELPKAMKRVIETGVNRFRKERETSKSDAPVQEKQYSEKFKNVIDEACRQAMGTRAPGKATISNLTGEEIWSSLSEDDKKFIYGDIVEAPWSDAHLHGGTSFEQTYNTALHAEDLDYRHPLITRSTDIGLMNVAGVHGNILETPEVACEKYMRELRKKFHIASDAGEFVIENKKFGIRMTSSELEQDFLDKQRAWYRQAYDNQKPIIGGMSGHTLGYLNLYKGAYDKASETKTPEEMKDLPTLDTFRGIMLAALTGNKRHHSYDEVCAAATGIKLENDDETMVYTDRVGYGDIMNSRDDKIKECAHKAVAEAKELYTDLQYDTVLSAIGLNKAGLKEKLVQPVNDYFTAIGSGSADEVKHAKKAIEDVVKKELQEQEA